MKKIIILFLLFCTYSLYSQSESLTLLEADKLISAKKYESAFKVLDEFDKTNSIPDIVMAKLDILLNYFVFSVNHRNFSLKDLDANENILDIRGKEGIYSVHNFPADTIINNLLKKYPNNCKLYNSLGTYYYEMFQYFNEKPPIEVHTLHGLIISNYKKVIDGKCDNFMTHYAIGFIYAIRSNYRESIPYLKKSIELNNKFPNSLYNLAFIYTILKDNTNALKYAELAFEQYNDNKLKSDAARLIGNLQMSNKDTVSALKYYEKANELLPNNYFNIKPLITLYAKNNASKFTEYSKKFYELEPTNPTIYNDLVAIYKDNNKIEVLIDFLKSQLNNPKNNNLINANLNFYLGTASLNVNKKKAKEYYLKAKEIFNLVYKPDHDVFKSIEEGIKKSEN